MRGLLSRRRFTGLCLASDPMAAEGGGKASDPAGLAVHRRIADGKTREGGSGCRSFRSPDGGVSFPCRIATIVNSPHGPCQLADGRLLHGGKELWTGGKRIGVGMSAVEGWTREWLAEIRACEGGAVGEYHELQAVQCKSGRIVLPLRDHYKANGGGTFHSESTDGAGIGRCRARSASGGVPRIFCGSATTVSS